MIISPIEILILVIAFTVLAGGLAAAIVAAVRAYRRKQIKPLLAGLIGWFIYQFIYTEFVWIYDPPIFWWLASIPISLIIVLMFFILEQAWIGSGIFIAIILNAIALISLSLAGIIEDGPIWAVFILFPPFFWELVFQLSA